MKKTYLAAACVVLAGAVTLAGCSIADIMHSYSSDEVFPYDVATEHGEDGSPESWLSSLQTPTTELRRRTLFTNFSKSSASKTAASPFRRGCAPSCASTAPSRAR